MTEKPHLGKIEKWVRMQWGDRVRISGRSNGHPNFHGHDIITSYVVNHDEKTGEIETRNSRYTLVGPGDGT